VRFPRVAPHIKCYSGFDDINENEGDEIAKIIGLST